LARNFSKKHAPKQFVFKKCFSILLQTKWFKTLKIQENISIFFRKHIF